MFDSHCHLHDAQIVRDAPWLIERAQKAGVTGFLLAGVDPEGWAVQTELMQNHEGLYSAFGVHPQRIAELERSEAAAMVQALEARLAQPVRGLCAVGEIGLDGSQGRGPTRALQEEMFIAQLALAQRFDLPVVLHVLDAHRAALDLLAAHALPARGGVLHSCSASAELVQEYLALGLYISFCGPITNPNAKRTLRAAQIVPADRLLVETDAPFQTPRPHRPALNEPAFLRANIEALAQVRGESAEDLAWRTNQNARRLFGIT